MLDTKFSRNILIQKLLKQFDTIGFRKKFDTIFYRKSLLLNLLEKII